MGLSRTSQGQYSLRVSGLWIAREKDVKVSFRLAKRTSLAFNALIDVTEPCSSCHDLLAAVRSLLLAYLFG